MNLSACCINSDERLPRSAAANEQCGRRPVFKRPWMARLRRTLWLAGRSQPMHPDARCRRNIVTKESAVTKEAAASWDVPHPHPAAAAAKEVLRAAGAAGVARHKRLPARPCKCECAYTRVGLRPAVW